MALRDILERYRNRAQNERDKGTAFELLALAYFRHDPMQKDAYDGAWAYQEWAKLTGLPGNDAGIDLVAKISGEDAYCAIQCKFYEEGYRIQRADLDSFFAASGKTHFARRIVIDTTNGDWGSNAQDLLTNQSPPVYRIGLTDLEASPIDWSRFLQSDEITLAPKKEARPHQVQAVAAVKAGLTEADRGKLIMACGTGKTFTGLKMAEELAGPGKRVLFMVPSLALMSQTVREWTNDAAVKLRSFAVCSDAQVGRRGDGGEDYADIDSYDLAYPATTDPKKLADKAKLAAPDEMVVVFSTYQSIETISQAQYVCNLPDFDLIICDEAHRTTGAKFADEEESNFIKIHSDEFVRGAKRIYMTATPRVYGEGVRQKADEASVALCSMDDEAIYGKTLFTRGFSWAVENGLLTDYKVIVLAVDEGTVAEGIQRRLTEGSELRLDDATKIIGCYKALTKDGLVEDLALDQRPMSRALAFCKDIKTSKLVTRQFAAVVDEYLDSEEARTGEDESRLRCELEHVDGTFNAKSREHLLNWLKAENEGSCRILSNARCLSEGVDVPALDAILFLHPRKSQIDVVQSVGRVMRRAPGKKMGYVILPIAIPAGMTPEDALNDNERYRVVWQILNALRSHDERMDATINRIGYGERIDGKIEIIAVSNQVPVRKTAKPETAGLGKGSTTDGGDDRTSISRPVPEPEQFSLWVDEFAAAIRAKIVKKCGTKTYWEDWAGDIARIADVHITRIKATLSKQGTAERAAFDSFLAELRDDLNPSVSEDEAIEMLAQHIITKPVFDAMFEDYSFAKNNSIAQALDGVLAAIHADSLEAERETLERFYGSVRRRAASLTTTEAKQKVIVQLYDSFFRNAFPKMTERLGIVYTPVEVVDFIIHSVNEVLQSEFGQTLGSKGVHILDPFTGTGTFITRLLQSGLIKPGELKHKYQNEIHANEIVLLAYYIAAINIEAAYYGASGGDHLPFDGICLTDTFQLYEQDRDLISDLMADNSSRRTKQKQRDIRVIVGNPPYSVGQSSANDNAANVAYPKLDARIRETYAAQSEATLKNALYDSYIRAIRWASDRLGGPGVAQRGVVAFVSNAGWIEGTATDGLRKCLADEFASIHVFHLRGNQRTSGERSKREGGKIFGSGSRTAVAITLLVKNSDSEEQGQVCFHDIGEYLSREEKLATVARYGSISGISAVSGWQSVAPDEHGDWINQRDGDFEEFISLGDKTTSSKKKLFETYFNGLKTGRDVWCFNSSLQRGAAAAASMRDFFNDEVTRYIDAGSPPSVEDFLESDPTKFSWNRMSRQKVVRRSPLTEETLRHNIALYRPFQKQQLHIYLDITDLATVVRHAFPTEGIQNRAIILPGNGAAASFTPLMVDVPPSLQPYHNTQCFPRYLYGEKEHAAEYVQGDLLQDQSQKSEKMQRRDAITDEGVAHFSCLYPSEKITKDDLFYYVYGLLHSEEYCTRYADNLSKQLPRIPAVKQVADFWRFVEAGRKLGDLHCNFDQAASYAVTFQRGDTSLAPPSDPEKFYRVDQMKFAGKRPNLDKTTIIYNSNITITDIPLDAYDYVVNGKSAIDWVMERQCVKTDKASGIVNDSNRYAIETMNDPAYPLKLLQRVITISLETMKIVRGLPKLEIMEPKNG